MSSPLAGALLAFLGGCVISYVNYRINLYALRRRTSLLATLSAVRQLLSVAYFVLVYALTRALPWGLAPLLGAAVGLTVPSVLLAMRLARKNDAGEGPAKDTSSEKGEEDHG